MYPEQTCKLFIGEFDKEEKIKATPLKLDPTPTPLKLTKLKQSSTKKSLSLSLFLILVWRNSVDLNQAECR